MRFVPIKLLKDGMKVGRTIYNEKGIPLLYANASLNNNHISKLIELGYQGLLIDDDISKNIEYEEGFLSQELKFTIATKVKDTFSRFSNNKESMYNNLDDLIVMVDDIVTKVLSSRDLTLNLLELKMFDNYTYFHSINVAIIALVLGKHLQLNSKELRDLCLSGLFHDVGKIFVSQEILNKSGRLTEEEFEIIKSHSQQGYDILKKNPILSSKVCVAVLSHHEHYDGNGYPNRLKGEKISLFARILCIADVYDALTSNRPYRKACVPAEGIEYIMANGGKLFDPELVNLFISKVYPYPAGSLVRLSNNEVGMVIENNNTLCLRPTIKIKDRIVNLLGSQQYRSVTILGLLDTP